MARYALAILFILSAGGCGFKPPEDSSGRNPEVVVQEFLRAIETDRAQDFLLSGSVEKINDSWYSGYCYERYCRQLSRYDNCEFTTGTGKGGYWHVRLAGDIEGFPRSEKRFALKLSDGQWIIDETWPHVPFTLPEVDHAAREAFASFIIEIVSPPIGHHQYSLFDHRDSIDVQRENYERALSHCSARVIEAARHAASLEEFFHLNLPFLHEDVRSPVYYVSKDRPGEILVVLCYFKPTAGEKSGFDYWTCLLVETTDGWKCEFFVSPDRENLDDLGSGEEYVFEGGDGASRESAVVIRGVAPLSYHVAEGYWAAKNHPDWRILQRVPVVWDDDNKAYDDVDYVTADGKTRRVYFDVSEPFYHRIATSKPDSRPNAPPDR